MGIDWSKKHASEAELFFSTDLKNGLTEKYIRKNREIYGKNEIDSEFLRKQNFYGMEHKKNDVRAIFSRSADIFSAIFAVMLLVSQIIRPDAKNYVLLAFLAFWIIFTAFHGIKTESRFIKLYNASRPKMLVIRGNKRRKIFIEAIVPGDIIILSGGDIVPADARIISSNALVVSEDFFGQRRTNKKTEDISSNDNAIIKNNIVYASSIIVSGNAVCITVATGKNCMCHKTAASDSRQNREPNQNENRKKQAASSPRNPQSRSAVQEGAAKLSSMLTLIKIAFSIMVIMTGIISGRDLGSVIILTLCAAVSLTSEQIPLLADYGLIHIMSKTAENGLFIKHTATIDRLNRLDVLIANKNDTMIQKKMSLEGIYYNYWHYGIDMKNVSQIGVIVSYMALCCNTETVKKNGETKYIGGAVDVAVYGALQKLGIDISAVEESCKRLEKSTYDPVSGIKATVTMTAGGKFLIICLGDAENVIDRCSRRFHNKRFLENDGRSKAMLKNKVNDFYKSYGLVLAVAVKEYTYDNSADILSSAREMDFVGIVNFSEPKYSSVAMALSQFKNAGIRTVVLSESSNQATSQFAQKHGISNAVSEDFEIGKQNIARTKGVSVVTGKELDGMNDIVLFSSVEKINIFSGVDSSHKLRIAKALKLRKRETALTIKDLADLPVAHESSVSFADMVSENSIITNRASVVAKSVSLPALLAAVKAAVFAHTNVTDMLSLLFSGYLIQYFLFFLFFFNISADGNGEQSASLSAGILLIWFSFGICAMFAFSLAGRVKNDGWIEKRLKIKRELSKKSELGALRSAVKKGFFHSISVIPSLILSSASLSFFSDYFLVSPKKTLLAKLSDTFLNLCALSPETVNAAIFLALFSSYAFLTLSIAQKGFIFSPSVLRNNRFIATVAVNILLIILIFLINPLANLIGFHRLPSAATAISLISGILPAIFNEASKKRESLRRDYGG